MTLLLLQLLHQFEISGAPVVGTRQHDDIKQRHGSDIRRPEGRSRDRGHEKLVGELKLALQHIKANLRPGFKLLALREKLAQRSEARFGDIEFIRLDIRRIELKEVNDTQVNFAHFR